MKDTGGVSGQRGKEKLYVVFLYANEAETLDRCSYRLREDLDSEWAFTVPSLCGWLRV